MDDLQDRFRSELEREMEERWRTSSLAEWMETHHGDAAKLLAHKRMDGQRPRLYLVRHLICAGPFGLVHPRRLP